MPNPALFPAPPTRKQVEGRVPVMTMKHEDGREVPERSPPPAVRDQVGDLLANEESGQPLRDE
jgi:hypothetical protein